MNNQKQIEAIEDKIADEDQRQEAIEFSVTDERPDDAGRNQPPREPPSGRTAGAGTTNFKRGQTDADSFTTN